jgi:hypothetical protein
MGFETTNHRGANPALRLVSRLSWEMQSVCLAQLRPHVYAVISYSVTKQLTYY